MKTSALTPPPETDRRNSATASLNWRGNEESETEQRGQGLLRRNTEGGLS
jgi:hypothetical protein